MYDLDAVDEEEEGARGRLRSYERRQLVHLMYNCTSTK